MCNIGEAISRMFTVPGTGGAEAMMAAAQKSANDALLAQKQAQDQATAASDSSSEAVRLAEESRLRKLLAAGTFGSGTSSGGMGPAPVGTRQLFGA